MIMCEKAQFDINFKGTIEIFSLIQIPENTSAI